jgi:hypothetical protein
VDWAHSNRLSVACEGRLHLALAFKGTFEPRNHLAVLILAMGQEGQNAVRADNPSSISDQKNREGVKLQMLSCSRVIETTLLLTHGSLEELNPGARSKPGR